MTRRVIKSVALMIVVVALALVPGVSSADLIGSADVVLTLTDPNVQISDTVTVGSGPELIGAAAGADWFLELTVTGFVLSAQCPEAVDCRFESLLLSLSSLDFAPPAALAGVTILGGELVDAAALGNPSVTVTTASSVEIDFAEADDIDGFTIVTGGIGARTEVEGTFQVEQLAAVPLPATLLVLSFGALAAGALALRRTRG